ncbi:hypothetical protein KR222_009458, partial [Zaprionus bogoriensis]
TVPSFTGKVHFAGEPYQIVRIIEYLVPKSGNLTVSPRTAAGMKDSSTDSNKKVPIRFIMKVIKDNKPICMGSLIRDNMVLSSASCFRGNPLASDYQLQDTRKQLHEVSSILRGTSFGNELALLLLETKIEQTYIAPIPLCNRQLSNGDNVLMFMSKTERHFLRTQIVQNSVCKQSYMLNESVYILSNMMCVHNSNIAKDCSLVAVGDPLLYEGRLCGISVYEPSCGQNVDNGNLYTDIFKSLDFIKWMIYHHKA